MQAPQKHDLAEEKTDLGHSAEAFGRARWLAELAVAIDAAEEVAQGLLQSGGQVAETRALQERLQAMKREVEDLRLGGWRTPSREIGSKRIELGNA